MIFWLHFALGIVIGMVAEYWVHRLQHARVLSAQEHAIHHMANETHSVWHEFTMYVRLGWQPVAVLAVLIGFLFEPYAGMGLAIGITCFFGFVAYTHKLYHTDENLVRWTRPLHYFHHKKKQWKHNFGMTNTIMDRLFDTFLDEPTWTRKPTRTRDLFMVKWF